MKAIVIFCVFLSLQLLAQETRYHPSLILVKPKAGTNDISAVHVRLGMQVCKSFRRFGGLQVLRLPPAADVLETVEEYKRSGLVEYAEPSYRSIQANQTIPNDTSFNSLWNMHNTTQDADIDAPEAWSFRTDAHSVIVGVIDEGVSYSHPDLALNMWLNPGEIPGNSQDDDGNGYVDDIHGIDAKNGNGNPAPQGDKHGTHISGIIGAVGNNALGVAGVAWRVRIMAFFQEFIPDVIECIDYAIAEGAHILNLSYFYINDSQALRDAVRAAGNYGIIFVTAAGNDGSSIDEFPGYPAAYDLDNVVTVANTTSSDALATGSNWGLLNVDIAAPGTSILSTSLNNGYSTESGTSMAAPHVAGAFALLKAQFPNDSYLQLINRMFSSVDALSNLSNKCVTGGRLNLHKALTSTHSRPRNDNFNMSYGIVVPNGQTAITATGNNVDATTEAGEPNHAGGYGGRSVWWHWPSPSSAGTVEMRCQGSTFNTRLAVYTGWAVSNLTLVASNVVTDSCSWSKVNFNYTTGTTYRIAVDGYNGAVGSIKLTVQTNSSTTSTNLSFDPTTLARLSGKFRATILGPANQTVTLDRYSSASKEWSAGYASFTLSASGTYNYTNSSTSDAYQFYRCQIGSLKSCNAVGYADVTWSSGYSMIANPFKAGDNRLNTVLPNMPDGTYLHKFDEVVDQYYDPNAYLSGSGWTDTNMTLAPGEGAIIELPSQTSVSFVGECQQGYLVNSVASGYAIRSARAPISGPVAAGLRAPILEGDIIIRMMSGTYRHFAYHNGLWISNTVQVAEPVIKLGESFWIVKPGDWQQISSVWP